ncbi:hypothetical protein [Salinibius halmophilus]|uniref:hypothetical protein n=1 Tax=Salinibius halmophilus TaxID=1853216 RepID=UPI000E668276|nr:hypothetical protein [Salinibius halmophilus]
MKRMVAFTFGCALSTLAAAGSWTMEASYAPANINPQVAAANQVAEEVGNGWEFGGSYGTRYLRGRASAGFYSPEDFNVSSIVVSNGSDTYTIDNEAGFYSFTLEAVAEYNHMRWVHAGVGVGRMFLSGQRSYSMPDGGYCSNCPSNEEFDLTGGYFVRPTLSINLLNGHNHPDPSAYLSLQVGYQKFLTESGLQDNIQTGISFKFVN